MHAATRVLYWAVALIGVVGGTAAAFAPSLVLPEAQPGTLASHLVREQGAGFVFIGLVAAWCARHEPARRPAHYVFLIFTGLLAVIHWMGYLSSGHYVQAAIANSIPFVAFAATLPWTGTQTRRTAPR